MERRETVAGEEEESVGPKAFAAAALRRSEMGTSVESVFASTTIATPSSRATAMVVVTPGAPPLWIRICQRGMMSPTRQMGAAALAHIMA